MNITRSLIEEALPVGRTEVVEDQHQPPTSIDRSQVEDQDNGEHPPSDEHLTNDEDPQSEEVPESNKHLVQNIQSLIERVAPDLDKPNEPEPDENAPKEVRDAYVSQYIRSSLNVALPTFERLTPSTSLVFPALSYKNREIAHAAVSEDADSVETLPAPPPLPPPIEEELRTMLSNYKTWDSKVYFGLRLDPRSIRLVEILPGSSDEIHVELSKKPLDEIKNAYEALSYVWGPPTPARMIQVNGVSVQVNPNLLDALLALRLPRCQTRDLNRCHLH